METIIDGAILMDFFKTQPKQIPLGTEEDNLLWISFWSFLKSKTDLDVRNYNYGDDFQDAFFKNLTTGRGDSKIVIDNESPIHNEGVVLAKKPNTLYCLNEEDENNKEIQENKNGFVVSFLNNYKKQWKQLSLLHHIKTLSVREDAYIKSSTFTSWTMLGDYLTKFTDIVIVDNYIFNSQELIPSNFEKILIELGKATPVKFNLTIYTFEGIGQIKLNGVNIMRNLKKFIKKYNIGCKIAQHRINCNIQLIVANRIVREHDRNIITNYQLIKSGDSFNYFNSNGNVITKGTDISFSSLTEPDIRASAKNILSNVNKNINELTNKSPERIYGKCDNLLLTQFEKLS